MPEYMVRLALLRNKRCSPGGLTSMYDGVDLSGLTNTQQRRSELGGIEWFAHGAYRATGREWTGHGRIISAVPVDFAAKNMEDLATQLGV